MTNAIDPPAYLGPIGRDVFRQTIQHLASTYALDLATVPLVARYASAAEKLDMAEQKMAAEGIVVPATRTKVPMQSPWLSIARQAAAEMTRLERLLGLAPARRNVRIAANPIGADGSRVPPAELRAAGLFILPESDAA
jgi:P27 family predicted phage terminase small subunit